MPLRSPFILAASVLIATPALAQSTSSGFALDRFEPAARGSDFFAADTLDLRGSLRPAVGLTLDLADRPLVVYADDGSQLGAPVKRELFAHLGASLVIAERLRIGLSLPVELDEAGDTTAFNGTTLPAASGAAVGDPRVSADVRLLGTADEAFTLAVGADVWLPLGSQDHWTGDGKVRAQPHVAAAGTVGPVTYAARAGFTYRGLDDALAGTPRGSEIAYAAGVGVRPIPALLVGPELFGSTVASDFFGRGDSPAELLLGAHAHLGDVLVGAGLGRGLDQSVGSPTLRYLLSVDWAPQYVPPVLDRDGDGVPDDRDACPDQRGLPSADPRADGCPDSDGDGILDPLDACPGVAGVASSDPKKNGCPADRDGDGIADGADACPDAAGVASPDPKKNGCPPDLDGDGVPDRVDACIDVPGVKTDDPKTNGCPGDRDHDGVRDDQDACPDQPGPAELHGCPDKDTDGDGVPDRIDNCPAEKGPKENAGCPPKQKQLVIITREKLEIRDKVYFQTDKAVIEAKSFKLLDQIANVIRTHPDIAGVRIEGHTDDRGKAEHNRALSRARAESVREYLISRGIEPTRLEAQGFGPDRPVDSNKTAAGRANNRRVEFILVQPAAKP